MKVCTSYINGEFLEANHENLFPIINPANQCVSGHISMVGIGECDQTLKAAKKGFETYSKFTLAERRQLLEKLLEVYKNRYGEIALAISTEMGAPISLATESQAECGIGHMQAALKAFDDFEFEKPIGNRANLIAAPAGVCVFITPWNWPMNQIFSKLAPALLCGCSVILKPSEFAPLSAHLVAQCVDEAGYPPGVFNLIYGDGSLVGKLLCQSKDVDLISFTGSNATAALIESMLVGSGKRFIAELGGKSANIIFADADFPEAIHRGLKHCFNNTGQSCNAPTRMLVERSKYAEAVEIAVQFAKKIKVNYPNLEGDHIGPLAMNRQYQQFQSYLEIGVHEGADMVCGLHGRHPNFNSGYFVTPTIFANVSPEMRIAQEEIFGPVLVMIPFDGEENAIEIANGTNYGLAAYIQTADHTKARRIAREMRAGSVHINGAYQDYDSPFGGFKKSGVGREWGIYGFHHFTEYQCVNGYFSVEESAS